MNKSSLRNRASSVAAVTFVLLSGSGWAQSIWMGDSKEPSISLEVLKPNFKHGDGISTTTSVLFLGIQAALNDKFVFHGELPLSHIAVDSSLEDEEFGRSSDRIGNPYVGIEIRDLAEGLSAEVGARAPLLSADSDEDIGAFAMGVSTELVDRIEAFLPDTVPVSAALDYRKEVASGFSVRLRGGPSAWIPTKGGDSELFALYSAQGWFTAGNLELGGGLSGRQHLTGNSDEDSNVNQVGLGASYGFGRFRPGVEVRVPLDQSLRDLAGSVIGLNMKVSF